MTKSVNQILLEGKNNLTEELQKYLLVLDEWATKQKEKFSVSMCKMMHTGEKVQTHNYNGE